MVENDKITVWLVKMYNTADDYEQQTTHHCTRVRGVWI